MKPSKSKKLKNLFRYLPEDLNSFRLNCPNCSNQFSPEWFEIRNHAIVPIKPNNCEGAERYIPSSIKEKCPFCRGFVTLQLPYSKIQSKVMLFGDEAYREEQGNLVFTYSVVGADFRIVPQIEESLSKLKLELCPSELPENWAFHMKELWSGNHRKKHKIFCTWSFEKVLLAVQGLAQVLQDYAGSVFIQNIALTAKGSMKGFEPKPALECSRDNAYILFVMHLINEVTKAGGQPVLQFDAEKLTKANQAIQGWARDAFLGSQHCLLYPFLARGIEIPEPTFIQPASHPCLELADFISYIVARLYLKKWQGKEIEEILDPCNVGKVTYLGYDKSGDLVYDTTVGYPWKLFYGS